MNVLKHYAKAYENDANSKHSINSLKAIRKRFKKTIKDSAARHAALEKINGVIRYKQVLYFGFCKYIINFKWGMPLKKARFK